MVGLDHKGYIGYPESEKQESYDYGEDDQSVLYVKGSVKTRLVALMSAREKNRVDRVIEKFRN